MRDYKKYIYALRKCAEEHDYDTTFTGNVNVSYLCRDTANLLEELIQESIPDKITPKEFKEIMTEIALFDDIESAHIEADNIIIRLLKAFGYSEGADIFDNMPKWYA